MPSRLIDAVEEKGLIVERVFGLQALPPLATNDKELFSESYTRECWENRIVVSVKTILRLYCWCNSKKRVE